MSFKLTDNEAAAVDHLVKDGYDLKDVLLALSCLDKPEAASPVVNVQNMHIAERLPAIGARAYKRNRKNRRWTEGEDKILHERYRTMSATDLAQSLGRTQSAILSRAHSLGLAVPKSGSKSNGHAVHH